MVLSCCASDNRNSCFGVKAENVPETNPANHPDLMQNFFPPDGDRLQSTERCLIPGQIFEY